MNLIAPQKKLQIHVDNVGRIRSSYVFATVIDNLAVTPKSRRDDSYYSRGIYSGAMEAVELKTRAVGTRNFNRVSRCIVAKKQSFPDGLISAALQVPRSGYLSFLVP